MSCNLIHNALVNKVQTQTICNCRITVRAVIWSTSYFPNVSIFLLTVLGGLPENPGGRVALDYSLRTAGFRRRVAKNHKGGTVFKYNLGCMQKLSQKVGCDM